MKIMTLTSRISCMALAVLAVPASAAVTMAPHRAFYVLEAHHIGDRAGITDLSGKLAYEITGNECDGYSVSYRLVNRYEQQGGAPQTVDMQSSSFESGDGLELDLRQKNYTNGKLDTEYSVKAKKPKDGGTGEGEFVEKDTLDFEIPADAVFSTAFQRQMMQDAEQGKSRSSAVIYEGSDKDKTVRAISFIGPKMQGSKIEKGADAAVLADLSKLPAWPVTVSYYNMNAKGDELPSYTASFTMLENGVSTNLLLDYGAYALKGRLEKIEMLKPETCK